MAGINGLLFPLILLGLILGTLALSSLLYPANYRYREWEQTTGNPKAVDFIFTMMPITYLAILFITTTMIKGDQNDILPK